MVRTSVTHSAAPRVPRFCSYHILTSSVICECNIYLVNAISEWVKVAHTASYESTIEDLHHMFATHGVQDTIVSDNASSFTSEQFARFCSRNNINHVTRAPFHLASNGLAEQTVQSFKTMLKQINSL